MTKPLTEKQIAARARMRAREWTGLLVSRKAADDDGYLPPTYSPEYRTRPGRIGQVQVGRRSERE